MAKTILVGGFGPGISASVAEKFGKEGFSVAISARSADKLEAGAKALRDKGVNATAFPADLGDPAAVEKLVADVRAKLGPVSVLQWNAYGGMDAGDLLTADLAAVRRIFDVPVIGFLTAIRAVLPDMRKEKEAAILVTNGGLAYYDATIDARAAEYGLMGLSVGNAAKHKMVGMLSAKLKSEGIYVGEIVVTGTVKGTAFDNGSNATLEGATVANKFWDLYTSRSELSVKA